MVPIVRCLWEVNVTGILGGRRGAARLRNSNLVHVPSKMTPGGAGTHRGRGASDVARRRRPSLVSVARRRRRTYRTRPVRRAETSSRDELRAKLRTGLLGTQGGA